MNCLPVVEMEMRSASRRKWTFGLRLLFAVAGTGVGLVVLALPRLSTAERGQTMLGTLSFVSLVFCLAAGGFLTADCVSSEKREGTLGLLFLTPLTGMDIVLGKMVCRGLQTFYGLCAVFPVFLLALLAGGVTWGEVCRILLALVLALSFSASVGMFVSVLGTESRSTLQATFAGVVLTAVAPMLYLMVARTFSRAPFPGAGLHQLSPVFTVLAGFDSQYAGAKGRGLFWGSVIAVSATSFLLFRGSGFLLPRVFRALGARRSAARTESVPAALRHELHRNPYEWAVLRTAGKAGSLGVLSTVFLCFVAAMVLGSLAADTRGGEAAFALAFYAAFLMHLTAKLRLAVEATRQISMDRQSGALELLLVTPLPEARILEGHQDALRAIARKPLWTVVCVNLALELVSLGRQDSSHMDAQGEALFTVVMLGGAALAWADFRAMRWRALWHGLRARNHVKAALLTFSSIMIPPWVGTGVALAWLINARPASAGSFALVVSLWVGLCLVYDWSTVRYCRRGLIGGLRRLASEGH